MLPIETVRLLENISIIPSYSLSLTPNLRLLSWFWFLIKLKFHLKKVNLYANLQSKHVHKLFVFMITIFVFPKVSLMPRDKSHDFSWSHDSSRTL